jgi:AbrB family looped-hinge helix DNA binding protein
MTNIMTKLGKGGRIVIPPEYRRALHLEPGHEIILVLEDGEVHLLTPQRALLRAQALVRRYVPPGRSLAKELLRERREEAARG